MKTKGHAIVPSAPVFLEDDKSTLFTSAGMQPIVPYLVGKPHPAGKRIADSQKCIRTDDIEEVGDNRHLTMFEMLGNWSLGDYFKDESIAWSWEFLTDEKWLGLDSNKIYITVYEGDAQVPPDEDSERIWAAQFNSADVNIEGRIQRRGFKDNWWALGPVGPCGPDTEIFYYIGDETDPKFEDTDEFIEVWNNVFMVYDRAADGQLTELPNKNVDTGMGLERTAATMQGVDTVFETDLLKRIQVAIIDYASANFDQVFKETDLEMGKAIHIITDHLRCAVFMAADGVVPSNTDRGYVMRRIIRRAIRQALVLGIRTNLSENIAPVIVSLYNEAYPELEAHSTKILDVLDREESQFRTTLDRGVKELERRFAPRQIIGAPGFVPSLGDEDDKNTDPRSEYYKARIIDGEIIFFLFDSRGFPPELSIEEIQGINRMRKASGLSEVVIDPNWDEDFQRLMNEQKDRSRTATAGDFKGGLADHEPGTIKHHTATHLMYEALRQVLGQHVVQRGSNVNDERLRFDFTHDSKMTDEQKTEVERIVNEAIDADLRVSFEERPTEQAFKDGAKGAFGDKYGDTVKVYTIGKSGEKPFSVEICGGPHVDRTGQLGKFKLQKEESSSAGVRRIKAKLLS